MAKAKPFIKWVGGKTQLIEQLDAQLPADFCLRDKSIGNWEDVTYIEPFVGGGALRDRYKTTEKILQKIWSCEILFVILQKLKS